MNAPLLAVSGTVVLGLMSGVLLKEASSRPDLPPAFVALAFLAVLGVNGLRFLLWNRVHKHHPVSLSYPLGSVFFPMILLVDHFFYGGPMTPLKIVASLVIMAGVGLLTLGEKA